MNERSKLSLFMMFHKKVFHSLHSHSSCCFLDLRRMLFMVISHAVRPVRSLPSHSPRSVCARLTAAESEPSEEACSLLHTWQLLSLYQLMICSFVGWFGVKSFLLLFSVFYSAAGKCKAHAAASWCHNAGLCSKVLNLLLRGQAEIPPSHRKTSFCVSSLSRQLLSKSGFVLESEKTCSSQRP